MQDWVKETGLAEDPSHTTVTLKVETSRLRLNKFVGGCDFGESRYSLGGLPVPGLRFLLHPERKKELEAEEGGRGCWVELAVVSGLGLKGRVDCPLMLEH